MNIEEINKKHYIKQELHNRVNRGLASRLLRFEDGIMHVELEVRSKWDKSINGAVVEIAHNWKKNVAELDQAIGCKVYIIDCKAYPYKRTLRHLNIRPGYDHLKGILFNRSLIN